MVYIMPPDDDGFDPIAEGAGGAGGSAGEGAEGLAAEAGGAGALVPDAPDATGNSVAPEVMQIAGAIKWFDASKGYGFIIPDNGMPDVLLHVTVLRSSGYQTAYEGARVVCEVLNRPPKGLQAFRVVSMDESTAIHPSQLPSRTSQTTRAPS